MQHAALLSLAILFTSVVVVKDVGAASAASLLRVSWAASPTGLTTPFSPPKTATRLVPVMPPLSTNWTLARLKPPGAYVVSHEEVCRALAASARRHNLPVLFFARLIWFESRFNRWAVSPAGALGVAQIMPSVAAEIGLDDPFDPIKALPASAQLLSDLHQRFGNWGLAAAAYNAGSRRVRDWMNQRGGMPRETRRYVTAITGLPPERWTDLTTKNVEFRRPDRVPCDNLPQAESHAFAGVPMPPVRPGSRGRPAPVVVATRTAPASAAPGPEHTAGIFQMASLAALSAPQSVSSAATRAVPSVVARQPETVASSVAIGPVPPPRSAQTRSDPAGYAPVSSTPVSSNPASSAPVASAPVPSAPVRSAPPSSSTAVRSAPVWPDPVRSAATVAVPARPAPVDVGKEGPAATGAVHVAGRPAPVLASAVTDRAWIAALADAREPGKPDQRLAALAPALAPPLAALGRSPMTVAAAAGAPGARAPVSSPAARRAPSPPAVAGAPAVATAPASLTAFGALTAIAYAGLVSRSAVPAGTGLVPDTGRAPTITPLTGLAMLATQQPHAAPVPAVAPDRTLAAAAPNVAQGERGTPMPAPVAGPAPPAIAYPPRQRAEWPPVRRHDDTMLTDPPAPPLASTATVTSTATAITGGGDPLATARVTAPAAAPLRPGVAVTAAAVVVALREAPIPRGSVTAREPDDPASMAPGRVDPAPWGVQLAVHFSREQAMARYDRMRRQYRTVLAGHEAVAVSGSRLGGRGAARVQVQVAMQTRQEAEDLCGRLRQAGGACLVTRN